MTRKSTTQKSHVTIERAAELLQDNESLKRVNEELCKEIRALRTANESIVKQNMELQGGELKEKIDTAYVQRMFGALQDRMTKLEEWNKKLESRITWYVERIDTLDAKTATHQGLLCKLTEPVKSSPQDDIVYLNAMRAMRLDAPPTVTDVSFVQTGAKKYPKEIANSKEFYAWVAKYGKEIFEILGK